MAGRAPLAIKHRSRMARCTQNMPTCAQTKKHLERSYKYVPFWGLCMRWNWICRTICWTETSHTQKLCYTHTYGIRYTRMKILIGHSAHFAPPCPIAHRPIAHRPLRIQSGMSYYIQIQCSRDKLQVGQVQRGLSIQKRQENLRYSSICHIKYGRF